MADRSKNQTNPVEARKILKISGSGSDPGTHEVKSIMLTGSPPTQRRRPHSTDRSATSSLIFGGDRQRDTTETGAPTRPVFPQETVRTNGWMDIEDERAVESVALMRKKIQELEEDKRRRKEKCKRRKQEKLSLTSTLNQYLKQLAEGEHRQEQLQIEVHALKEFSVSLVAEKETLLEQLNSSYEEQQLLNASIDDREKAAGAVKLLEEENQVLVNKISETLREVNALTLSNQDMHTQLQRAAKKIQAAEAAHELVVQKKDQEIKALEEEMESIKELWRASLETQSQIQNHNLKLVRRIEALECDIKAVADPNPKLAVEKLLNDREPLLMYACKSMTDKTTLFSYAIKTEDTDVILTVVLFLEYSLSEKHFEPMLFSSPEATKCYLQYLKKKDTKQFKQLALRSKHFEEVGLYLFEKATLEQDTQKRIQRLEKCLEFCRKYNCLQAHIDEIEGWLIDHKLKPFKGQMNLPPPPALTPTQHPKPAHVPAKGAPSPSKGSASLSATSPTTASATTTAMAASATTTVTAATPIQPAKTPSQPSKTPTQPAKTPSQPSKTPSQPANKQAHTPSPNVANHHVQNHLVAAHNIQSSPKTSPTKQAQRRPIVDTSHSIAQSQFKELVQTVKATQRLTTSNGQAKKIRS